MTVTGAQLVTIGESHFNLPYWNLDNTRFGPYHMDCSGYMVRIIREAGIDVPGNAENSEGLLLWARQYGLEISLDDAYQHPGALVSKWGTGNGGHVGMVRTPTSSIETPAWGPYGHASGSRNLTDGSGRNWTNGNLVPGVDYTGLGVLEDLKGLAASLNGAVKIVLTYGETNHPIATKWLQIMLNRVCPLGQLPLKVDGVYGHSTLFALCNWEAHAEKFLKLKDDNILPDSGKTTPAVWYWLRLAAKI